MAQLFDIRRVVIGPRSFVAEVELAPSAPLLTSDDEEGTELILSLMPGLAEHACLGDSSSVFGEVVASTELAHLLEHVTVELLARTDVAGDITSGQTVETGERVYEITLSCPDDVLVAGALSSAVWILQWAYSGGGEPVPNVEATVSGLVALVESLGDEEEQEPVEEEPAEEDVDAGATTVFEAQVVETADDAGAPAEDDAALEGATTVFEAIAPEPEPEPELAPVPEDGRAEQVQGDMAAVPMAPEPEPLEEELPTEPVDEAAPAENDAATGQDAPDEGAAPSARPWDMGNYPRPHLVR